jgi:hypothetical protein
MYRRLANAKFFGGFAYSGVGSDDEVCYFYGPFFDVGFQRLALPYMVDGLFICREGGKNDSERRVS